MNIDYNFFKNRQKSYLHFDYPLPPEKIFSFVTNPQNIEKHSFFPFIHFEISSYKIKKKGYKVVNGKKTTIVEKKPPKIRPIKYSAHIDGHIYAYYAYLLSENYEKILFEKNISDSVLAFRKLPESPNNIHFAKNVFDEIKNRKDCSVLCIDIKSFFDELDHQLLKKSWQNILGLEILPKDHYKVFRSITKFSYVHKNDVYHHLNLSLNQNYKNLKRLCSVSEFREKIRKKEIIKTHTDSKGIPQGSAISAFLSNIYMLDFDEKIHIKVEKAGGKYYRYCDDILIICNKKDHLYILTDIQALIKKLNLVIHPEKTKIVHFANGLRVSKDELQYLGFTYDGKKILLRDTGLAKYSHKVMKAIKMSNKHLLKINQARINRGELPLERHKKHIYRRFSFIGSRNYISYALRASKIMNEPAIKKQIKPHWKKIQQHIQKYEYNNSFHYCSEWSIQHTHR
ncbi:antiviral reverse transcriptase Drt2 [Acinetobacter sp. DSM 11652]|uniref:antiviral reverse transcriptase Drt2 n=1 Tax=Acinetobacter sp. DSM 11652 TaxID=346222 RepID=UPI0008AE26B5|nr:antiviral reverse transcriptase Drt2 [Acinetobacter sp. DSM 11652]SEL63633.1 Reverse transcriptase (RNA-dependent DNA polymerase) [Acinetobacter sp. DSM 11652]